ncbi:MAG: hypothetical protein HC923_08935 [Myxococcales bacterium]|nr:hypothetical protein [Myxococcales bacterium]
MSRHLLGLIATRPAVSVEVAAEIWCRENGIPESKALLEPLLVQAAFRLSLVGRAALDFVKGPMWLRRPGAWPHVFLYLLFASTSN